MLVPADQYETICHSLQLAVTNRTTPERSALPSTASKEAASALTKCWVCVGPATMEAERRPPLNPSHEQACMPGKDCQSHLIG